LAVKPENGVSCFRAIVPLLMLCLTGCHSKSQPVAHGPTSVPAMQQSWTEHPIATPPQSVLPVKEGTAPLVYMVEADTVVRVVDKDINVELLNMPVMARQIVSVNPELGVMVGGAVIYRGSLPASHRYQIYLQSNTESIRRTGYIRPGAAPEAGRQP
jgi:hypothetical protein